ncbi:periodic tryptophan protein 2 homolog [Pteropus vampyrus]|uniref:Periodic tryptophan protein 2 homolog n=1 Tax=Pteropus vampyrus TaxID=132908 RepID=A0A6P3R3P4_PTEVA|nr:periodic tryptophan protein 2 homolog [Pteropus vampyrus]
MALVFSLSNKSNTLPLATRYNVKCVGLSPDGRLAIIVDEGGEALLVSLVCRSVLHRFHFKGSVHSVCFSPDGRKFVVTKGNIAQMYHAPGRKREFNAFVLDKTYFGPYDETTCIDWTDDSRCFAVGSKDMSTWVFGAERWDNLIYYALGGHKDAVVACFFESSSLDLYTLSQDGALCVWQCDTPPEGLRLKPPRGWKADLLRREEEGDEDEEDGAQETTIRGQAVPATEDQQGKVKYSRLAKYFFNKEGDFNNLTAAAYHKKTHLLVTGFASGIVKVWNTLSGFCFITFTEHSSGVTGVTFTTTGYVIVTSSMDGTVRAFDLHRYRNFRTFTSPRPTQFSCVAVDSSGEIVSAGAQDSFEIFIWSMQTGRLLEVLSGHEGPISGLCFSPTKSVLASASWDRTVRLWDMVDSWRTTETLTLTSDALAVTFRPDGAELAVATLNSQITFWDPENAVQTGSIEGRHDLKTGRRELDKITAKHSAKGKGCVENLSTVVAAGTPAQQRQALGEEFLNRKKMTEFGNLALIDQDAAEESGVAIPLPGVKKGDMSSRHFKPEIRVTSLRFSPTGRCWAATTTEGLLIYSLDAQLLFDPFELDTSVTPGRVRAALRQRDFTRAVLMAFRLNERELLQETLESMPWDEIEVISSSLPELYVEKVLEFLASSFEVSRHLEFYLIWTQKLLLAHGQKLKSRAGTLLPVVQFLQKGIQRHLDDISKLCDWNRYNIQYALAVSRQRGVKRPSEPLGSEEEADASDQDSLQLFGAGLGDGDRLQV